MLNFDYKTLPWNIIFGAGAIKRLPAELDSMGLHRALILSTPEQKDQAEQIVKLLDKRVASLFDQAVMHVPIETVDQATVIMKQVNADCSISIGGGSTTGLGKALKLREDLPNIAIPTTYAGSEMTDIWGVTEQGKKTTGRDAQVVPELTLYDPELTLSLPAHIAGPSGLNAMAHSVINITTRDDNPLVKLMAEEAIRALARSLPIVVKEPGNLQARSDVLYGACLAGGALGTGITGIHHRLCHTLGGAFNTPHAETHTILLPHCVAYNASAVPEETQRVAKALGASNAAQGIFDLAISVGARTALKDIGMQESDLDEAAKLSIEKPLTNPEPVTYQGVRLLLDNAFHGRVPQA